MCLDGEKAQDARAMAMQESDRGRGLGIGAQHSEMIRAARARDKMRQCVNLIEQGGTVSDLEEAARLLRPLALKVLASDPG